MLSFETYQKCIYLDLDSSCKSIYITKKKKKKIYLRDKLYQDFKGIYLRQKINIDRYTNKIIE